ncbi:MAG: TonB-dependent receptor, partial [Gammaproteobacteria bacterium]|nr:TonB-dependent receptor [Gammaproteobacteria bacterium]
MAKTKNLSAAILLGLLWSIPGLGDQELITAKAGDGQVGGGDFATDTNLLLQDIPSVFSASKYEQKISEAPSSVSVITADEITQYGYRTLDDILNSLRGFTVVDDRNYSYVAVRGFGQPGDYNTRLLLLVDGFRVNDNLYASAVSGRDFLIDVDLIERVEVIRGPSSSLYGSSAFFGVINVITKSARQVNGTEIVGSYGEFDTLEGRVTHGGTYGNGVQVLLSLSRFETDGDDLFFPEFDDPETNNGIAENSDYEETDNFFAKVAYGDFAMQAAYVSREKGIPTGSYGTIFNDPRNRTVDDVFQLGGRYERALTSEIDLRADLVYHRYDYEGGYVYDYSEDDEPRLVVNQDTALGEWWGAEAQLTLNNFTDHRVVIGAEYRDNFRQNQGNFDEEVYLDDRRDSIVWGLYFADEYQIHERVRLNAGLRYDVHSEYESSSNPRLGLIYQATPRTVVKLLYGTAFRAPNAYEQYYNDDFETTKPAGNLDPETIETTELVVEHSVRPSLRFIGSVYHYVVEDLITLTTDPADELLVFENTGSVEAHGVEVELEGRLPNNWKGRLSYAYQETDLSSTGER